MVSVILANQSLIRCHRPAAEECDTSVNTNNNIRILMPFILDIIFTPLWPYTHGAVTLTPVTLAYVNENLGIKVF